ncbi:MAG: hypothetical protein QM607_08190, partial [Microbacterium sp.]
PLHARAFGPWILAGDEPVPNEHSLLPHSDLVFVDPPGTGFSRIAHDEGRARLLSTVADTDAFEAFVRGWLERYDRTGAPLHFVGESFGGYRLARLAERLCDLRVGSIVFISPILDLTASEETVGNDLPFVFALPTMAAAAWFHGKASSHATDLESVWNAAEGFARSELLPALHLGSALDDVERDRLVAKVIALTGLRTETIAAARLRVGTEEFLSTLRGSEGLLIGRLDVRITGPQPEPATGDRPASADDPALGVGRRNVIHSAPLARYLHAQVGVPGDESYVSLSLDVNFSWNWAPASTGPAFTASAVPSVAALLAACPDVRVLLIGGRFDLATPLAAAIHALRHGDIPPKNVEVLALDGGHSLDSATLPRAHEAVIRLIQNKSPHDDGRLLRTAEKEGDDG